MHLMAGNEEGLFDLTVPPVIVGRVPGLPQRLATELLEDPDPSNRLKEILQSKPEVGQALIVASPTLWDAADAWRNGGVVRNKRIVLRILSYILRMATRTTPFGLFGSIGEVPLGRTTTLRVKRDSHRTRSRPDMGWLLDITRRIERESISAGDLRLSVNGYILERGGRLFATSPDTSSLLEDGSRLETFYRPSSVKATPFVKAVLNAARKPATFERLANLVETAGTTPEKAREFVGRLYTAGLLLSSLRPSLTSTPLTDILNELPISAKLYVNKMDYVRQALAELDSEPIRFRSIGSYKNVAAIAQAIGSSRSYVQIDMHHQFEGSLGRDVIAEATRLADIWVRSTPVCGIGQYRRKFMERYGSAEFRVPLLELVDEDFGIGAPPGNVEIEEQITPLRRDALMRLALRGSGKNCIEVEISNEELTACLAPTRSRNQISDSVEIAFEVAARSIADVTAGRFTVVPAGLACTSEAGRSLGRFSDILPASTNGLRAFHESRSAAVVDAELLAAPTADRSWNVCIRPLIHPFTIRFGVSSAGEGVPEIPLDDLVVGLSEDRFHVWSRSLEREVRIHATHLLNPDGNFPSACRLLDLIPQDGRTYPVGFNWGPASGMPRLPRVRYGRLVIATASWTVQRERLHTERAKLDGVVRRWREEYSVPASVLLVDMDQRLLMNLETAIGLDLLHDQVERSKDEMLLFREVLPLDDELWLEHDGERYRAEFVASLASTLQRPNATFRDGASVDHPRRRLHPGSEWSFVKLYCGMGRMDSLLCGPIASLIGTLRAEGHLSSWFFVRFADPEPHIRLRIRTANAENIGALLARLNAFCADLAAGDLIDRFAFDTYVREFERYGGPDAYDEIEDCFMADSDASIEHLSNVGNSYDERVSRLILSFVTDFLAQLDVEARRGFRDALGRPPRRLSNDEREIVKKAQREILSHTQKAAKALSLNGLMEHQARGSLARDLNEILLSMLHMHCNRMGIAAGKDEQTVQELLWHTVTALIARGDHSFETRV
jgi:lantibiotic biosynthesis protein